MDENNVNNNLENTNNNVQDYNNMNQPNNTENPYYNPYFQENGEDANANSEFYNQPGQGMNQILAGSMPNVPVDNQVAENNGTEAQNASVNLFDLDNNQNVPNNTNDVVNGNNVQSNFDMNYTTQEQENFNNNYANQNQENYNMNYTAEPQNNYNMNYEQPQENYSMNNQAQNPLQDNTVYQNQTNNNKKKSGKKSAPIILIIVLLLVIVGAIVAAIVFLPSMLEKKPGVSNNVENNNIIDEPTSNYMLFNFYNDYGFEYDASKWGANTEDKILTSGNYKLICAQTLENLSTVGYDIKMPTDRASFFTFLYNQFSSQADVATTTVELGTSNFTLKNNVYYAYLDLVYGESIERCYFVLLPEEDVFIEFILSNEDTVIPDEMNNEVIEYISNIYKEGEENNGNGSTSFGNEITNDTIENNTITNTDFVNDIMNNSTTNETVDNNNIGIGSPTTSGIVLTTPNN